MNMSSHHVNSAVAVQREAMLLVRPVVLGTRQGGVAEQIAGKLRQAIIEGRLRPGDSLPSERDLADQYDVNRSSIREAMKRL